MNASKPACLSDIYRHVTCVSVSLGLMLNAIVLALILRRTPKELRVYSRVLIGTCIVDIVFLTITFVVDLHISFRGGIAVYVVDGLFTEEKLYFKFIMVVVYLFGLYLSIFATTPPFIYRYFMVCRNFTMPRLHYLCLMASEAFLAAVIAVAAWVLVWPVAEQTAADSALDSLGCSDPGQVPFFHDYEARSVRVASVILLCMSSVCLNYGITLFCSYKILRTLSTLRGIGHRQISLNRQLNRVFVLQAATPFFVAVIPAIAGLCAILFSTDGASTFMETVTTVEAFVPVLNPLYTMLFVKAYRHSILRCCRRSTVFASLTNPARSSQAITN